MLYLIGLGLNENSLTAEALEIIKNSDEIYLENYTVNFPYDKKILEEKTQKKIQELEREKVENEEIISRAKEKNIVLLVYGDSLSATTHIQLISACKEQKINFKIIHNASILTAVSETGLQLYKFGKTSSIPAWKESWKPCSFLDYVKENQSIGAHSLVLIDISLDIDKAIEQLKTALEEYDLDIDKIIVCKNLGTDKSEIIYDSLENISKKDIKPPYCFVIPGNLSDLEKKFLKN
jgi:diphthine synthase